MGLIVTLLDTLFGGGRNLLRETSEVFKANAENDAVRDANRLTAALNQHAAEFRDDRTPFDRLIDGLNRLPRPFLAFGTIGLFVSAMIDPSWFSTRMQGLALVPEPLWWLMGAVVSFYFGARHQYKGQQFQRDMIRAAGALRAGPAKSATTTDNPALDHWRAARSLGPATK